jgi:plasmid stabilization system protein ParE
MKARFLPAAVLELESAADDYEEAGPGLGSEFRQEVRSMVALIERHHRIGPSVNAGTKTALREFLLDRFPYRLIYSIEENDIMIVALAHQHRRLGYWRGRVEELVPAYAVPRAA